MATNRRRSTRSSRSSGLRSTAVKVYPTSGTADAAESSAPATAVDWDHEYHYIIKDLRQLAVVSVMLLVLLLVVGFLL